MRVIRPGSILVGWVPILIGAYQQSPLNDHLYSLFHVLDQPGCERKHIRESKHLHIDCPPYNYYHEWNNMIAEHK